MGEVTDGGWRGRLGRRDWNCTVIEGAVSPILWRWWWGVVLIGSAIYASTGVAATQTAAEGAFARSLAWLKQHPATPDDGGILDMIDEGLFFLLLGDLSRRSEERSEFLRAGRERMTAIDRLPQFEAWVHQPYKTLFEYYHLLLSAHLMRRAGQPSAYEQAIVDQASRALAESAAGGPTERLTVAVFVERLGGRPPVPVEPLLEHSLTEQLVRGLAHIPLPPLASPQQRFATGLSLYAVIHEVIALADFGRAVPLPEWLAARRDTLVKLLRDALSWARGAGNVDLLSELVMTLHVLGEPLCGEPGAAIDTLVATQHPDGTWGSQPTLRENRVRHAVLTATAVLFAYRNEVAQCPLTRSMGAPQLDCIRAPAASE